MIRTDVLIIGGGAAGLAAALGAEKQGARVLIVESGDLGGILNRCIHLGFGLARFGEELTGPEYAARDIAEVKASKRISVIRGTVTSLNPSLEAEIVSESGYEKVKARSVVLATGCRERAFGALEIAGTRPAGIFTAGAAQEFVNTEGRGIGKRIVILGSGDIGLIMARRFTLEGAKVEAVLEIMPHPGGLNRNIAQCLTDFKIPLELSTTVVEVRGDKRVEEVVVANVDENLKPIPDTKRTLRCDTLVLSVGLIPVMNLVPFVQTDRSTKGAVVNSHCMTAAPGIFVCGNALHVHDLVDNVSAESERAGRYAALHALGLSGKTELVLLHPGENVASVVPQLLVKGEDSEVYIRLKKPLADGRIVVSGREISVKKRGAMAPNETVVIKIEGGLIAENITVSAEGV